MSAAEVYPPEWCPLDPPDDLDRYVAEQWTDPAFREAWERRWALRCAGLVS
jgi:hypothetical protein